MKKFILLLLILPLTLMARPEKKWLQEPVAGFLGSIKWTGTDLGDDDCNFATSATGVTPISMTADADCDDVAATKVGDLVSSDVSLGSIDIRKPQIIFSKIPKGILRCIAKGSFESSTAGAQRNMRFYDGTNNTAIMINYTSGATYNASGIVDGEFVYETDQTNITIEIQMGAASGTLTINARNTFEDDLEISCYWYPIYPDNLSIKFK